MASFLDVSWLFGFVWASFREYLSLLWLVVCASLTLALSSFPIMLACYGLVFCIACSGLALAVTLYQLLSICFVPARGPVRPALGFLLTR